MAKKSENKVEMKFKVGDRVKVVSGNQFENGSIFTIGEVDPSRKLPYGVHKNERTVTYWAENELELVSDEKMNITKDVMKIGKDIERIRESIGKYFKKSGYNFTDEHIELAKSSHQHLYDAIIDLLKIVK